MKAIDLMLGNVIKYHCICGEFIPYKIDSILCEEVTLEDPYGDYCCPKCKAQIYKVSEGFILDVDVNEKWLDYLGFSKSYSSKLRTTYEFEKDLRFSYTISHDKQLYSTGLEFMGKIMERVDKVHLVQNVIKSISGI